MVLFLHAPIAALVPIQKIALDFRSHSIISVLISPSCIELMGKGTKGDCEDGHALTPVGHSIDDCSAQFGLREVQK